jgi:uncharacterized damage-inducible protein DinB
MTTLPWTERTFQFGFPAGLFPSILERVRGTPARLEELVHALPPRILAAKINAGWSIQEHAGHLLDLEELHGARLDDFRTRMPALRAADMSNRRTFEANHNAAQINDILASFRKARVRFVQRIEQLDDSSLLNTALHPRLQTPMRVIDMAYFVAEHDDHHLAAIHRIAATLK